MITSLDNGFEPLSKYINNLRPSKIFILADDQTHEKCLPAVLANLETEIPFEILEVEHGEEMKVVETAAELWSILAEFQADRKALILNLGGGVITDMGGFVASTYKRGIKFINLPTTLLAMCDASIGGKTGIDHGYLKNIVGTFAEPEQIFLYTPFLKTLPFRELRSGFAEMLKHGLIADKNHWEDLTKIEDITAESVAQLIQRSMEIKEKVVREDFMEQNVRKILNFGHTVGHALESLFIKSGKPVAHGEGVAAGMVCETKIAALEGLISDKDAEIVIEKINSFFPKLDISGFLMEEIMLLMQNDKKNSAQKISFSLINGIGSCQYDYHANEDHILASLAFYGGEIH